jgi:hypothetical protein
MAYQNQVFLSGVWNGSRHSISKKSEWMISVKLDVRTVWVKVYDNLLTNIKPGLVDIEGELNPAITNTFVEAYSIKNQEGL